MPFDRLDSYQVLESYEMDRALSKCAKWSTLIKYNYHSFSSTTPGNCVRSVIDEAALLKVLRQCRDLVARSEDSEWSCMDTKDILKRIDHASQRWEQSLSVEIDELRFLFLPTGPLQETSMSNGWADEFLVLAESFDEIIGESS